MYKQLNMDLQYTILYKFYCRIGVIRSMNLMGIIRKTRNVLKNLRFCGKEKHFTFQITSILKRLTLTRLQAFTSRIITFKIFNSSSCSCVDHHFFIFFLLPSTNLDSSGDENLFHKSRKFSETSDFFLLTEFLGVVTEKRECVPGGLFSLECPPGGRQMF